MWRRIRRLSRYNGSSFAGTQAAATSQSLRAPKRVTPPEESHPTTPQDRVAARLAAEAAAQAAQKARAAQRIVRRPIIEGALLFAAVAAVATVAYLAFAVPGAWFTSVSSMAWGPAQMSLARGTGAISGGALVITSVDANGAAVVSLNTDLPSSDYRTITWEATNIPASADVPMFWRSDLAPSRLNAIAVNVSGGRLLRVELAGHPNWLGRVTGLALAIRAPLSEPIRIGRVRASPMGALDVVRERVREWFAFEGWSGASINGISGGAAAQEVPLPVFLALVALVAIAIYMLLYRRTRQTMAVPIAIGTIFVLAWVLCDVRWQSNLFRQAIATHAQYGGKDLRDKHLAAEDGFMFAFIEAIRTKLPPTPARIFVVADVHYLRDRAAYHLYPHNVFFDPYLNTTPPVAALRPGDYLLVYQRRGIQYSPSEKRLRMPDGATTGAEVIAADRGAVLLRIL